MKRRYVSEAAAAGIGLFVLILDSKTAMYGAREGVDLCIRVLIPTLFPFFFLSAVLSGRLNKFTVSGTRWMSKLFRIPSGSETLLLCGLLGGYPVGAQMVDAARQRGNLSDSDAKRMLCICNQCGPAFIFGISAVLFDTPQAGWTLFLIQIISALITAFLLPGKSDTPSRLNPQITARHPMDQALRSMANVCGWVILFKTLIAFLNRWILWALPCWLQTVVAGVLELSNGCLMLNELTDTTLKFILCAGFMSFGGLCVTLQTFSLIKYTDKKLYFPAKLMQCSIAMALAAALCLRTMFMVFATVGLLTAIFLRKNENKCRNSQILVV